MMFFDDETTRTEASYYLEDLSMNLGEIDLISSSTSFFKVTKIDSPFMEVT